MVPVQPAGQNGLFAVTPKSLQAEAVLFQSAGRGGAHVSLQALVMQLQPAERGRQLQVSKISGRVGTVKGMQRQVVHFSQKGRHSSR